MRISDWSSDVCSSDLEEFYQANCPPRSGERPGLGLGLATVQRLCALLEIPITLHSQLGHGCLFSVHVPMAATPRPEIAAPAASDQPLDVSGLRVLVIDDEPIILDRKRTRLNSMH